MTPLPPPSGAPQPGPLLAHETTRAAVEAAARAHLVAKRSQLWDGPGLLTSDDGLVKAVKFATDLWFALTSGMTLTGTPLTQIMEAFLEGRLAALQADVSHLTPARL